MAAFDSAIAEFATTGKGVKSTYDDEKERDRFIKESNTRLFPNDTTIANAAVAGMDLQVMDKHGKIKVFIELDRSGAERIGHWGFISLLERKVENVMSAYQIAPVFMVYLNKHITNYWVYSFHPDFLWKYPLQTVDYTNWAPPKDYPKHPRDYQHRIALKHAELRTMGG